MFTHDNLNKFISNAVSIGETQREMDINEEHEHKLDLDDESNEDVAAKEVKLAFITHSPFGDVLPSSMNNISQQTTEHELLIQIDPFDTLMARISPSISRKVTNVKMTSYPFFFINTDSKLCAVVLLKKAFDPGGSECAHR